MKKMILAAALASAALPAFAQAPAEASAPAPLPDADPAIWAVKDADTTIYLFGTAHALDGKTAWFNDEVKSAYDASNEVYFEIIPPEPAAAQAAVMEFAVDKSGKTLTSKLPPETAAKLAAELAAVGAPPNAFDHFDPWFAGMSLAVLGMQKMGIKQEHGAEAVLMAAAKEDGKTIGEIENFRWQIELFDSMPEELQLALLESSLEDMAEIDEVMGKLVASWSTGDIEAMAALLNESMRDHPKLAKLLLTDRNARWAEWIDERLDKPGTVFMAVGAGHLGGADSVQAMLEKKGIEAEKVEG